MLVGAPCDYIISLNGRSHPSGHTMAVKYMQWVLTFCRYGMIGKAPLNEHISHVAHLSATRQKDNAQCRGGVAFKGAQAGAVHHGPDLQSLVTRCCDDGLFAWGKLYCPDTPSVTPQHNTCHQIGQLPYLHAAVLAFEFGIGQPMKMAAETKSICCNKWSACKA